MRILKIRLKNLNSLVGDWEIDLTDPAYESNGIFAITGPTGSGKTTILDAVCLALYGRTPRLEKVNSSGNEIMSRMTGKCLAEVTFENKSGRFRCLWSQQRANKKFNGDLQGQKWELVDDKTGELMAAGVKQVVARVIELTGMDDEQFTRSMLLAQGSFAAFLQAKSAEKSPILEQLTGTGGYAEISKAVQRRSAEEDKRLQELRSALEGIQPLSDEDETSLLSSRDSKKAEASGLATAIDQLKACTGWLDGIGSLEEDLRQIEQQADVHGTRSEAFLPRRAILERANDAKELVADYTLLTSLRTEQENERTNLARSEGEVPAAQKCVVEAVAALAEGTAELDGARQARDKDLVLSQKARAFDLLIREKEGPQKRTAREIEEKKLSLETQVNKANATSRQLSEKRAELDELSLRVVETAGDEPLVDGLAWILFQFDASKELHSQRQTSLSGAEAARKAHAAAQATSGATDADLQRRESKLSEALAALEKQRNGLKVLLNGRELSDWRSVVASLQERQNVLLRAIDLNSQLTKELAVADDLEQQIHRDTAHESDLKKELGEGAARQQELESEVAHLDTEVSLRDRIRSLEQERGRLEDGNPCPLCGSLEHPYARGQTPEALDEAERKLKTAKAGLIKAQSHVSDLRVQLAGVAKDIEQAKKRVKESADRIADARNRLEEDCSRLGISEKQDLGVALEQLKKENAGAFRNHTTVVEEAEKGEKLCEELRTACDAMRERVEQVRREAQAAKHDMEKAQKEFERLNGEAGEQESSLAQVLRAVSKKTRQFGIGIDSVEDLGPAEKALRARREARLGYAKRHEALMHEADKLSEKLAGYEEGIRGIKEELDRQEQVLALLVAERERLSKERCDLYGTRDPDVEEKRLSQTVAAAEAALEDLRRRQHDAQVGLESLTNRILGAAKSIEERDKRLFVAGDVFGQRLAGLGFADEAEFNNARLDEAERKNLAAEASKLDAERIELDARLSDCRNRLQAERSRDLTSRSRDELTGEIEASEVSVNALREEIGGIEHQLKVNRELKDRQSSQVAAIRAQETEAGRWKRLDTLIGSHDGKKYRNFAQGLTFEIMVGHANEQLRKMTDRYLLVRDNHNVDDPLQLCVIDKYQAGEVRTTKNLSGGESFLVSLALALGLSRMASKKTRVDSLFLDEGFGTLDDEAMESALQTLASLRQEGKLIGIISHVAAIRERIAAQIRVIPETGGRSRIEGPGCRAMAGV